MIKRYILHVEFHWGYWPRISFRRAPKPGDRVLNGDEMGTLKLCPECQDGLLHEPDWRARQKLRPYTGSWHATAPAMDFNEIMPSDIVDAPVRSWMDPTLSYSAIPKAKVSMIARDDQDLTELLLKEGSLKYEVGEIVWYNKANHRVVAFEENKRVLLRRLQD